MEQDSLMFFVNGNQIIEKNADPETTLLSYLRNNLRLTGSKLACGEGGCGACTVMVSRWDEKMKKPIHYTVNACLSPVVSMHECAVTTVEGIGSTKTRLHKVQERLARYHGSQCGFCTPGIVMSMYALLRNEKIPSADDIETCMQGNLCRCTGYRPIRSAFRTFTCGMGDKCCKLVENGPLTNGCSDPSEIWSPYDPTQEPIFPPILAQTSKSAQKSLTFHGESVIWHQPADLREMLALKSRYPDARIVVGNTEIGIEMNIKGKTYPHLISPRSVSELNILSADSDGVTIGATCSLTEVEKYLRKICGEKLPEETQVLRSIVDMLQLFAGVQIRNVACIGGNVMTASPISDLNQILMACEAKLTFASTSAGEREIKIDEQFFTGYRRTNTKQDEVLVSLKIPFLTKNDVMYAYKQSKRKDDDIAIVNAGMLVNFEPGTSTISKLFIAYGGMDAVTKIPSKALQKAVGRSWDSMLLQDVCQWLGDEMNLSMNAPGGMMQYRRTLAISFFFKFYHRAFCSLVERGIFQENNVKLSRSIINQCFAADEDYSSSQTWHQVSCVQSAEDTIGEPVLHLAGLKHVTGEAQYIDDIPPYKDELHMAPVLSTRAHAKVLSVYTEKARSSPGVVDYVDVRDVVGENLVWNNEDVFSDGKVTCVGHVVGAIVADTHEHAVKAAKLVRIEYEDIIPRIITIEDAIKHNSFYDIIKLVKGDVIEGFKVADHVLECEMRVGGQEHFYLEPQSCIAVPRNGESEMELFSSTQDPAFVQRTAAVCLGLPIHKVVVRTKRMGGAFGGKETKACKIANPAVIAARKHGRPVRCILTRQDDMVLTGGRHPFLARYKIGFNDDGRVVALKIQLYSNGGNTSDLSVSVMHKAIWQSDNCYNVLNAEVTGYVCRTNIPSNTAFRGFGSIQATIIAEDWITRVAGVLNIEPETVRQVNLYKVGDKLIHGATIKELHVRRCWDECLQKADFKEQRIKVDEFNSKNRWKKRGISCVPTKYSIAFGLKRLNQAGALVLVYTDGTVLLSHGGSEMGQGLHTKMIQIAGRTLGIPLDLIHISETSTATVPNASPTASSVSSDINGMAVKEACEKIMKRLDQLKKCDPGLSWKELVTKAYDERISLAATGFYRIPGIDSTWDQKTGKFTGNWANYEVTGVAVSEVEIDVLTGHHVVLKTDIVMDIGNSLNPAIDIGQIEGAFTQGCGLVTLEEPLHSPYGQVWTTGPGAYKIPGFSDVPRKFNVHLLRDCPNEKAIYSSKAVGEPPMLLAISVFCAIKDAIKSARKDVNLHGSFRLDSPASAERIRLGCQDQFSRLGEVRSESSDDMMPWSVRT